MPKSKKEKVKEESEEEVEEVEKEESEKEESEKEESSDHEKTKKTKKGKKDEEEENEEEDADEKPKAKKNEDADEGEAEEKDDKKKLHPILCSSFSVDKIEFGAKDSTRSKFQEWVPTLYKYEDDEAAQPGILFQTPRITISQGGIPRLTANTIKNATNPQGWITDESKRDFFDFPLDPKDPNAMVLRQSVLEPMDKYLGKDGKKNIFKGMSKADMEQYIYVKMIKEPKKNTKKKKEEIAESKFISLPHFRVSFNHVFEDKSSNEKKSEKADDEEEDAEEKPKDKKSKKTKTSKNEDDLEVPDPLTDLSTKFFIVKVDEEGKTLDRKELKDIKTIKDASQVLTWGSTVRAIIVGRKIWIAKGGNEFGDKTYYKYGFKWKALQVEIIPRESNSAVDKAVEKYAFEDDGECGKVQKIPKEDDAEGNKDKPKKKKEKDEEEDDGKNKKKKKKKDDEINVEDDAAENDEEEEEKPAKKSKKKGKKEKEEKEENEDED